jgi:isopropylmalate/homocitrate/citramalate synthase
MMYSTIVHPVQQIGRRRLDGRLRQLGYHLNIDELNAAYARTVALASTQKFLTDGDLTYIAEASIQTPPAV